ncbi:MAG: hypothetical protein IKB60_04355, partial [Clostridia bacterium]|nr:hypothetical protein [Clostridia bacterium]
VNVKITEIDWEAKKISLSIRALLPVEEAPVVEAPAEEAKEEEETPVYKEELESTIGDAVEIGIPTEE